MKAIIEYECEVCHNRYKHLANAQHCEANPGDPVYQVGTIYSETGCRDAFYKNMTFVVAHNHVERHSNHVILWAFRDTSAGDSRSLKDVCGGSNSTHLSKRDVPDRNHPTFKRAVAFLKKHKIKAYVWTGKESVPL